MASGQINKVSADNVIETFNVDDAQQEKTNTRWPARDENYFDKPPYRIESIFCQGSRGEEFWLKKVIGELIWSLTQIMNRLMMVDEYDMLLDEMTTVVSQWRD